MKTLFTILLAIVAGVLILQTNFDTLKPYKPTLPWNELMDGFNENYETKDFEEYKR